jgi:DNA-binding response OmpR family regulator
MTPGVQGKSNVQRIMLVGRDHNQILRKRFQSVGWEVVAVDDSRNAIERARHESFDTTIVLSSGSALNVAETIFNLRDLNRSMEIILLVDRQAKHPNRFLRRLIEHPIGGTRILTRRQLRHDLHLSAPFPLPGG